MTEHNETTSERLELHNLAMLAKSAKAKITAGKPLSKKEIDAVAQLEERQKSERTADGGLDALAVVKLLVSSDPQRCDEAAIRATFGDRAFTSLTDVAAAFGVVHATVKHTWRANGMPGDGKRRRFPMADVLIWYLQRQAQNAEARGADEFTRRKREAETLAAEAEARIKLTRAEQVEGEYIPVPIVRNILGTCANKARDAVMGVARQLTPAFPKRYAAELTEETERLLRNALQALSDTSLDEFRERMTQETGA